jgi:c-di-GMP-binding flagellar brake protein YcgR
VDEAEEGARVVNRHEAEELRPSPLISQRVLLAIPTGVFEGSYVTKILDRSSDGLTVYAPSFRGTILPIPPGDALLLHFSSHGSHYEYECRVVRRHPGPIPTIVVTHVDDSLRRVQRRSFFRLGANIPLKIDPVSPLPGTPAPGPPSTGVSVNLSGGGLLLESPELYPEGALLDLTLEIPDGEAAAEVRSEVIRDAGRAAPGARATWFLAVEFLSVDDETKDRITRYIYLLQRAVRDRPFDADEPTP